MNKHYWGLTVLAYTSLIGGGFGTIMYLCYRIFYSSPPNPGMIGSAGAFVMIGLCTQAASQWLRALEKQVQSLLDAQDPSRKPH